MLLPARIQRILSMVRADVKLPPPPCSVPLSLSCLAQLLQVPGLLPAGFSIPSGKSGRAREEAGRLLLPAGIWVLRGDYQEGWSCVCAVPGSPGPFCHGLAPSGESAPRKASYLPHGASQAPAETVTLQSHRVPSPAPPESRVQARSARTRDHVGPLAWSPRFSAAFPRRFPSALPLATPKISVQAGQESPAQHQTSKMHLGHAEAKGQPATGRAEGEAQLPEKAILSYNSEEPDAPTHCSCIAMSSPGA